MWPWEHVAVGYLLYSAAIHAVRDRPPSRAGALAVGFGSLFPDLVDKTLAWVVGILPSGVSLAHSVFVAVALSVAAVLAARAMDRPEPGEAFAGGYLLHLPADAVYPALTGGSVKITPFLWPLVVAPAPVREGLFENLVYYVFEFLEFLATGRGVLYLTLELMLLGLAVGLWIHDGCPGLYRARGSPRT